MKGKIAVCLGAREPFELREYAYSSILSHHFRFDDINKAFALADRDEAIRISISFT